MSKLLVDTPYGFQEVIEVQESGAYFDSSRVVWDERRDGPLPLSITLGGMKRNGGALEFDAAKKAAHDAVLATKAAEKLDKETKRAARIALLKDKQASEKDRLQALIEYFGLDI